MGMNGSYQGSSSEGPIELDPSFPSETASKGREPTGMGVNTSRIYHAQQDQPCQTHSPDARTRKTWTRQGGIVNKTDPGRHARRDRISPQATHESVSTLARAAKRSWQDHRFSSSSSSSSDDDDGQHAGVGNGPGFVGWRCLQRHRPTIHKHVRSGLIPTPDRLHLHAG